MMVINRKLNLQSNFQILNRMIVSSEYKRYSEQLLLIRENPKVF